MQVRLHSLMGEKTREKREHTLRKSNDKINHKIAGGLAEEPENLMKEGDIRSKAGLRIPDYRFHTVLKYEAFDRGT